jgi:hypothetical protein
MCQSETGHSALREEEVDSTSLAISICIRMYPLAVKKFLHCPQSAVPSSEFSFITFVMLPYEKFQLLEPVHKFLNSGEIGRMGFGRDLEFFQIARHFF